MHYFSGFGMLFYSLKHMCPDREMQLGTATMAAYYNVVGENFNAGKMEPGGSSNGGTVDLAMDGTIDDRATDGQIKTNDKQNAL